MAINGRFEHLRSTALGFRNFAYCIIRSLSDIAGSDPGCTIFGDEPVNIVNQDPTF